MKMNFLLNTFALFTATVMQAQTVWDFSKITDANTIPDVKNRQMLKVEGTAKKSQEGVFSPRNSYFTGSAKKFSIEKGTFKVCFKLKEYNDWDGILQTHIGFKENGTAKYLGLGFKRISTGIFQAHSIPLSKGMKNIITQGSAKLDDEKFHTVVLTYEKGKVKDGKGVNLYIDGKLIGRSDYDSSKCWNKGNFFLGTTFNKNHAPAICFKRLEYSSQVIPPVEKQTLNINSGGNIAQNADFEKLRSDKWVKNWSKCSTFSLDTTTSHTGKNSLRYNNNDPKKYLFPESPLNLEVGKRYKLSGWIKVKDIKGPGVGACIAIEYYNADNKYLGGTYTKGMKGTDSRWTEFTQVTNSIPTGTTRCRLICFVRNGMTGIAWFDNITVKPFYDPFFKGITTDVYRDETSGGKVTVKAGINWESDKGKLSKEKVNLQLIMQRASDNKEVCKIKPDYIKGNVVAFNFDASTLKTGNYTLKCLMKKEDSEINEAISCSFEKLSEDKKRKVYIDKHKRLIVNGKPFFPLGTYWSKVKEEELKTYSQSAFNCLMPYEMLSKTQMDIIEKYGLKTFYSIKDCYFGTRWCPKEIKSHKEAEKYVIQKINNFSQHPALLAWYINDERPLSMLDILVARQKLVKKHDPDHPTWTVLCKLDHISSLLPTFDVIGTDPYPIPDMPASVALDWTRITKNDSFNSRAIWMVPQIFNWASYSKVEAERKRFRPPTLLEMRSMAWQCIAGGANGLIFYSWFDMKNMDKVDPFDKRWKEVSEMATEIKKFIPVLLSVDSTPVYKVNKPETVACRLYNYQGNSYLVAVNSSQKTVEVKFEFEKLFGNAEALMGKNSLKLNGKELKLVLAPLEPKMIKLVK
jgi:hypothetical protein